MLYLRGYRSKRKACALLSNTRGPTLNSNKLDVSEFNLVDRTLTFIACPFSSHADLILLHIDADSCKRSSGNCAVTMVCPLRYMKSATSAICQESTLSVIRARDSHFIIYKIRHVILYRVHCMLEFFDSSFPRLLLCMPCGLHWPMASTDPSPLSISHLHKKKK